MATLKELAERTGYAPATISRILSGDPTLCVTAEARRRVLEEAGKLNYTATRSRRGRTPKSVLRIGVAEMLSPAQQLDDPYYLYLSSYVRQGCLDQRYTLVPLERRGRGFSAPEGAALDGIVAIGLFTPAQITALAALHSNLVFLDSAPYEDRFDSVVLNYELGLRLALEHLQQQGHRHIAFAGPSEKLDDRCQPAPEIRWELFRRLQSNASAMLVNCPMQTGAAAGAISAVLDAAPIRPTALLCANEEVALGALQAARQAGLRVPEQLSVVSFNDTPRSVLVDPPLTSICAHVHQMALAALRLLAERAETGAHTPVRTIPVKLVVPPSLIVRESSGPAPGDKNQ